MDARKRDLNESDAAPQIVVDTSIMREVGGDLTRGDWPALRAAARLGSCTLHLPAVVLQELVDHRRRDLARLDKTERQAAQLRDRLRLSNTGTAAMHVSLSRAKIEELCDLYGRELTEWFHDVGSVLHHPRVTHQELVERLLRRRRPFTEGEKGYRDALVWYSALERADYGRVILATSNTGDFAKSVDGSFELADDLAADLDAAGLPPASLALSTSTSTLLRDVLPEWDDQWIKAAWEAYLLTPAAAKALDDLVDKWLGLELHRPPRDVPSWIWAVGLRSVSVVTTVTKTHAVEEGGGWHRVSARARCLGRIGGYVWAWGDPDADTEGFHLWDDWGGLTEYFAEESLREVDIVVSARFRPPVEVEEFDLVRAVPAGTEAGVGDVGAMSRVWRSMKALLSMLTLHADSPDFIEDVLTHRSDEFAMVVGGVLAAWEEIADSGASRYPTLASDNVETLLKDPAGLQALRRDLGLAIEALDASFADADRS